MRRFGRWVGLLILLAALAGTGWFLWPLVFPQLPQTWLSQLAKADAMLAQGRVDLAQRELTPIPQSLPVEGWRQWENRARKMALVSGDWRFAAAVAASARRGYPGNQDLAAFWVWVSLKNGQAVQALPVVQKVLTDTRWAGLREQTLIEAQGWVSAGWNAWLEELSQPSDRSVKEYQTLAQWNDDPRISHNALLAALGVGDWNTAREIWAGLSRDARGAPPFQSLEAYFAFDDGDWSRAIALFRSMSDPEPAALLALADAFLHQGDRASAKTVYDQLLHQTTGSIAPALAMNRARMALEDHDPALALSVLQRLEQPTPEADLLTLEARFQSGQSDAVRQALLERARAVPETTESVQAELLKDSLFPDLLSVPRLWSLLHRHPDMAPLAERLSWILLQAQDFDGVDRALSLYRSTTAPLEDPWWSKEIQGFRWAELDQLGNAIDVWKTIPDGYRDAVYYANSSLLWLVKGQQGVPDDRRAAFDASLRDLDLGFQKLPNDLSQSDHARRARWLVRRAELQLALMTLETAAQRSDLLNSARNDLQSATALDPQNLQASFLLRESQTLPQDKS